MATDRGREELERAGFVVEEVLSANRWYAVLAPDGEAGAVLRQSPGAWHYFSKKYGATASGSSADRCHLGGLGDALDTDRQVRRYCELLGDGRVPPALRNYEGVRAAMSSAYEEMRRKD